MTGMTALRCTRRTRTNVSSAPVLWLLLMGAACSKKEAPQLQPAVAPSVPAPAPVVVRDGAADVVDAARDAGDAGDARGHGGAKKSAGAPAGGGSGGIKVEGSLSRADGEKVVRGAQGKLRACFEAAKTGGKGRVSFKLTVNDRGHVTLTQIPTSTLPGGSEVETCMVHVLRDLLFPRGSGESTISFQMNFAR
jgi:hypothetical protein